MPRRAREKSKTGVYHVIFRGINKQRIFEEEQDYRKFLYALKDQQPKSEYEIYAYCLMTNHIHLLMKEGEEELGTVFRRIASKYVQWYNGKYERVGHLFQDRFKSEVVETPGYFLGVLRYIHQNPLKAGMVQKLSDYPWSSYREYFEASNEASNEASDKTFGLKLCNQDMAVASLKEPSRNHPPDTYPQNTHDPITEEQRNKAKIFLKEFHKVPENKPYLEFDRSRRWRDEDAADFVKQQVYGKSPTVIQSYDPVRRAEIITTCKEYGISLRQLERITGIGYSILQRI